VPIRFGSRCPQIALRLYRVLYVFWDEKL